jgi:hypothetical protein
MGCKKYLFGLLYTITKIQDPVLRHKLYIQYSYVINRADSKSYTEEIIDESQCGWTSQN